MADSKRPKRRTPEARRASSPAQVFSDYLKRLESVRAYETPDELKPYLQNSGSPPPQWFQEAFAKVRDSYLQAPDPQKPGRWRVNVTSLDLVIWSVTIFPDALKTTLAQAFETYLLPYVETLEAGRNDPTIGVEIVDIAVNAYRENIETCLQRAFNLFHNVLAETLNNLTVEVAHEVALITPRETADELHPLRPFDFDDAVKKHEQFVMAMLNDRLGIAQSGRPPKQDSQKEQEAREKEKELVAMSKAIDQIIEEWPKKTKAAMTGENLCRELRRKGYELSPRTLTRRLSEIGCSLVWIKQQIEKNRAK